jgi:hypothetical protein
MVNLAARNKEVERPLLAGRKKVERPLQPNAARDSHNTERKREKKNHHRQAHSNFGAICNSGSGNKNSGAAFYVTHLLQGVCVRRQANGWRFTETPYKFGISRYINSAICVAFNAAPLSN